VLREKRPLLGRTFRTALAFLRIEGCSMVGANCFHRKPDPGRGPPHTGVTVLGIVAS
jgi:hypothetical protein